MSLQDFKKGVDVSENKIGSYELGTLTINKAKFIDAEESGIDLNKNPWARGRIFLKLDLLVKCNKYPEGKSHTETGVVSNSAGEKMTHPRFVSKDGNEVPASFLYDIVHSIKNFSPEQERELQDQVVTEELLEGKKFLMNVKFIESQSGYEFCILETDRQRAKDEEYKNKKALEKQDTQSNKETKKGLPF